MTRTLIRTVPVLLALAAPAVFTGCEREVLDVETPQGEVEVQEEMDGDVEIERD